MRTFETLDFDNTYARLPSVFYQRAHPTPLPNPILLSANPRACELIDLDPAQFARPDAAEFFGGNKLLPGSDPIAQLYSGHQFGNYNPQLGDGRAILLGEARGASGKRWDLQLKGAGPTAFSRGFDGRSVVRSAIREYLCSEAMHGLGIPTTRALCLVHAPSQVVLREQRETAATVVRMAPTHVRIGTFEVFAARRDTANVRILADYVIREQFPDLLVATTGSVTGTPTADTYAALLREVIASTARLMAHWMAVGFAHGVMNTDNFSILGLTLDYGPYGFLDAYDPGFICNHADAEGRYAFDQQPGIGQWNCYILANAMLSLMSETQAQSAIDGYADVFESTFGALMRSKIGLTTEEPGDPELVMSLLRLMADARPDYTITFRALGDLGDTEGTNDATWLARLGATPEATQWLDMWRKRLELEGGTFEKRRARMHAINPRIVLRNYMAQMAISGVEQHADPTEVNRLLDLLSDPFSDRADMAMYEAEPPSWGRQIEVSCSS